VAGVLEDPFVALHHRYLRGPRTGERRWIVDGELVDERVGIGAREALGQVQVLAGAAKRFLSVKLVVSTTSVFLPSGRVSHRASGAAAAARAAGRRPDDPRVVDHLREDHDRVAGLEDLDEVVVRPEADWRTGVEREAALLERPVSGPSAG